jgi:hypothetical protein
MATYAGVDRININRSRASWIRPKVGNGDDARRLYAPGAVGGASGPASRWARHAARAIRAAAGVAATRSFARARALTNAAVPMGVIFRREAVSVVGPGTTIGAAAAGVHARVYHGACRTR